MKSRPVSMLTFMTPLTQAAQRFAFSALVIVSLGLLVIGKADPGLIERARTATTDAFSPILLGLTQPVAAVEHGIGRVHDLVMLYRENDRLRQDNAELLQWQEIARRLEIENRQLRTLTNYQPEGVQFQTTARVIGTAGGAYSRNLLVDRGTMDQVAKGQAAATGTGLIGRVAEVGAKAARVLLITDLNSRIPVALESGERAILSGDNSDLPVLAYVPPHTKIERGAHIVTSGDGGVFPPGIPVGIVVSVDGGLIRVAPTTDLSRVDFVRLVDFGLSGVLPPSAVPAPKPAKPSRGAKGEADRMP